MSCRLRFVVVSRLEDLRFDPVADLDNIVDIDLLAGTAQLDGSVVPLPPDRRQASILAGGRDSGAKEPYRRHSLRFVCWWEGRKRKGRAGNSLGPWLDQILGRPLNDLMDLPVCPAS